MKLIWWLWHNFSNIFLRFDYNFFTLLQKTLYSLYPRVIPLLSMLCLGCGNSWHYSIYSFFVLSSVDTNNTNIVARSEPFIFIFYLHWNFIYVRWTGSSHSLDTLVFTVWFTRLIHVCCSSFQYGCLDLPLSWPASCGRACQKIVLGTPGFEAFGFLIHFAHFRNAEIVIWFICLFISL